jgi:hypothetical protein
VLYIYCKEYYTFIAKSFIQLLQRVLYIYCKEYYTFIAKSFIQLLQRVLYIYCKEFYTFIAKSIIHLLQRVLYIYCKEFYTFIAKSFIHLLQRVTAVYQTTRIHNHDLKNFKSKCLEKHLKGVVLLSKTTLKVNISLHLVSYDFLLKWRKQMKPSSARE